MKTFFKIVVIIIIIFVLLGIAQIVFDFNLGRAIDKFLNHVILRGVDINIGEEIRIPVFQIVSLEVFYPGAIGLIEADVQKIRGLEFGSIYLLLEYDFYTKFGVRNPETIKIERVGDTLYVDESSIVIELLDIKLNNYKYRRTFTSNFTVRPNLEDSVFIDSLNVISRELEERMIINGRANFEFAKNNFKENYKNMCNAMRLQVVYR